MKLFLKRHRRLKKKNKERKEKARKISIYDCTTSKLPLLIFWYFYYLWELCIFHFASLTETSASFCFHCLYYAFLPSLVLLIGY